MVDNSRPTDLSTSDLSTQEQSPEATKAVLLEPQFVIPFLLVASLFPLWGFANDVTNPLVRAFKDIFLISHTQSSLVQFAFYLGYGVMAIPAALFIRRFSYRSGILGGLALYALGAFLFIPACLYREFNYFLASLLILTCGLSLLETTANPYILSMGSPETATRRLNFAQAFNPMGSLIGMGVASLFILKHLEVEKFRDTLRMEDPSFATMLPSMADQKLSEALVHFAQTQPVQFEAMQRTDLISVAIPYVVIGTVVLALWVLFFRMRLPNTVQADTPFSWHECAQSYRRLIAHAPFREGVIAQAFYVGAQIACWTFVIHYGMSELGLTASQAQNYNIIAMLLFLTSRFICTGLLAYINSGLLLMILSIAGVGCVLGVIFLPDWWGLYSLISVSACMSLMFPTIYGIALDGLGHDASLGSAGLIMAIVGGALMPPAQGALIDLGSPVVALSDVRFSFILPALSFVVIALFGYRSIRRQGAIYLPVTSSAGLYDTNQLDRCVFSFWSF